MTQNQKISSITPFNWSMQSPRKIGIEKKYVELHQFRQEVIGQKPYELHQRRSRAYQLIFIGFGLLFLFFLGTLLFQRANEVCHLFHGVCFLAKSCLAGLSGFLSTLSFALAYQIRPEREAVNYIFQKAKRKLKHQYIQKCARHGWERFFLYSSAHTETLECRIVYQNNLERISELKEATWITLGQISGSRHLTTTQRNQLYNQALLEFQDKLLFSFE